MSPGKFCVSFSLEYLCEFISLPGTVSKKEGKGESLISLLLPYLQKTRELKSFKPILAAQKQETNQYLIPVKLKKLRKMSKTSNHCLKQFGLFCNFCVRINFSFSSPSTMKSQHIVVVSEILLGESWEKLKKVCLLWFLKKPHEGRESFVKLSTFLCSWTFSGLEVKGE